MVNEIHHIRPYVVGAGGWAWNDVGANGANFIRGVPSGRMERISFAVCRRGEWSEFHLRCAVGANGANFIRGVP